MATGDGLIITPRYHDTIAGAARIAIERGDGYLGVEHLMLAILADPHAVPTQDLRRLGLDPDAIGQALDNTMRSEAHNATSYRARMLDGRVVDGAPDINPS
ncbi:Clp protease N-terminal domain-containing protein [Nocardia brasiliensis]|uniref:Clp protease N-terminal domain-containing protein n=1 Tax=Nocardia brasiliensis TaxID=37326 RepID=UPI0004A6CCF7|nr:Clp protease N-terminal domain-containing protein [Nocardia brasiliensis]